MDPVPPLGGFEPPVPLIGEGLAIFPVICSACTKSLGVLCFFITFPVEGVKT